MTVVRPAWRVTVIGRLPGEASCLNLVWAVLDCASRGWRGMTMAPTGTRLLNDIRHQLVRSYGSCDGVFPG